MKPAGKGKGARQRDEKFKPSAPDQAWSMDFVADQLQDGTRLPSLTIVDGCTVHIRLQLTAISDDALAAMLKRAFHMIA